MVIVYGPIMNYNGNPQMGSGNFIYSLNGTVQEIPDGGQTISDGDYYITMTTADGNSTYAAVTVPESTAATTAKQITSTNITANPDLTALDETYKFAFTYVEAKNYYTIQDSYGRYLTGVSNSANFYFAAEVSDAAYWDVQVKDETAKTYSIKNVNSDVGEGETTVRYILLNTGSSSNAIAPYGGGAAYLDPKLTKAAAYITVDPTALEAAKDATSISFDIKSNTSWTVETDNAAYTVDPTSGTRNQTITVSFAANTGSEKIDVNITVKAADSNDGITDVVLPLVHLGASSKSVEVDTDKITVDASATSTTFKITSNTPWKVATDAENTTMTNVSFSASSGEGNENDGVTITVSFDKNTAHTAKTAVINVSGTDALGKTVTITQKAAPYTVGDLQALATSKYVANSTDRNILGTELDMAKAKVVAVPSTYEAVVGDETGYIYINKNNHGLAADSYVSVVGQVELSYGVTLKYSSPNADPLTNAEAIELPAIAAMSGSDFDSYYSNPPYFAKYVSLSGVVVINGSYKNIYVAGSSCGAYISAKAESAIADALTDGKGVAVEGYLYDVNTTNGYVTMYVTKVTEDTSMKPLTVSPASITWPYNSLEEKTIEVTTSADSWSYTCEETWLTITKEENTLKVTPKAANDSNDEAKTATITINNGSLVNTVTCKQNPIPPVHATYTLTFPDDNSASNKLSAYNKSWTAKIGDNSWTIANFNNNNWGNNWTYIKTGQKNNACTGTITTDWAIPQAIEKVVVTVDAVTADKVTSTTLEVATDAAFTSPQTVTVAAATGDLTYTVPTPTANCYYRLSYVCASGSNGILTISKVIYTNEQASE